MDVSADVKPSSSMDSSGAERLAWKDSSTGVMVNTSQSCALTKLQPFGEDQDVDAAGSVRTHYKHLVTYVIFC